MREELFLYHTGIEKCLHGHSCGPALRDHYLFHLVLAGHGCFKPPGQEFHLSTGDGFLIVPDRISSYRADLDQPWHYAWFAVHGSRAGAYFAEAGLHEHAPVVRLTKHGVVSEALTTLRQQSAHQAPVSLTEKRLLFTILDALRSQRADTTIPTQVQAGDELVSRAIDLMHCQLSQPLTVNHLAQRLGVSRSHLHQACVNSLGHGPKHHLTNLRMNQAVDLLRDPDLAIQVIAESVGYIDPLQFSRAFRRFIGESPSRFRERIRVPRAATKPAPPPSVGIGPW
ncbi:MAG: AraC family transcriptional regulator [Planctomycetota bacterium]|nr:AraC family transcriptional regulator [Planctomycetota bacterium]